MRDLAAKVGITDVGLKKLFKSYGIVTPPQGYWNKVHAGKPVPRCPKVPARRPGETGRLRIDHRFKNLLPAAEPLPSSGPYASANVPEDLDELYQQELKAIGRATVPSALERFHVGLAPIIKQEARRREKYAASNWSWDAPKFESAVNVRRLKLLNAVFMALSKRGHSGSARERDGDIEAGASVGDTAVSLSIQVAGAHRTVRVYGYDRPAPDLPASTPLKLVIGGDAKQPGQTWQDDKDGKLETKIAEVVASIIVAGEARFRRGLKQAEEWAEQHRRWEEQRRQEAIEARNAQRLKQLRESGDLLRQAEDLRALITRVRTAVLAGSVAVDQSRLERWECWAGAEADRLDPILSGQILTHLAPPEEGG